MRDAAAFLRLASHEPVQQETYSLSGGDCHQQGAGGRGGGARVHQGHAGGRYLCQLRYNWTLPTCHSTLYLFFYDLEIRTENRESEASEENVVRIPINYSEHKTNASSFGRTMETSSNQSQGSGITVSENVSRDFHDYENWTPRVLPTSPPDKPKEVRFKLPRGKE